MLYFMQVKFSLEAAKLALSNASHGVYDVSAGKSHQTNNGKSPSFAL